MIEPASPDARAWHHCPLVSALVDGATFFITIAVLLSLVPPAYAITFPVGNLFVVDLGDVAPWASIGVALLVYRRLVKKDREDARKLAELGVKIDGMLVDRDSAKVAEGEKKQEKKGADVAEALAEGQRQGRDIERESVAAQAAPAPAPAIGGKQPLPVADEKVGKAVERSAEALESSAKAITAVADATEKQK